MGDETFKDCTALSSISIPESVTTIGNSAFSGCQTLTSVLVGNSNPLSIDENAFSNRANATLYVPNGSKESYEAADYWKDFKSIVEVGHKLGDINGDGKVNIADVTALVNIILGKK